MKQNKITTRESLKKLQQNLQQEDFKKEFNTLFKNYINVKNVDKNAHYHAILKFLTDNGLDRHEAEDVFKQLRVKNADLIQNIQEIQKKREELDKNWNDKKWKLLANPLDIKTFASVIVDTLNDISLMFKQVEQQIKLNYANNKIFSEKIDEIKKLLYNTEQDLKQLIENDNENAFILNDAVKNIEKIADKAEELTVDVITKNVEKEAKEIEKENPQPEAETEHATDSTQKDDDILIDDTTQQESAQNDLTLEKALENSLHATLNTLDKEVDEKTLSFLVLSEYLHAYNNFDLKDVYEKFKDTFDKDEFKSIVIYNNALMNNDTDDVFDLSVEEGFEAVNIKEYAKMLKHNYPEYKQLDEQIEKELEIGVPTKNKKFTSIDI